MQKLLRTSLNAALSWKEMCFICGESIVSECNNQREVAFML